MTAIRITSLCSAAYRHWQSGIARIRTPLLLSAGRAAIDRYFLSASSPAAVGLLLWAHAGTDRRTDTVPLHRPWYAYYAGNANKQQWQFMEPGGVLRPIRVHRIGSVTVKLWCTNCCINELTCQLLANVLECYQKYKVSPRERRDDMPPLPLAVRRWQKSRRIYVRPRTGPQSAHLWWPAVAKLLAASVPIA